MMASRYGIFCLILFLAVLGLGFKNYETWSQPTAAVIKKEIPKKPEAKAEVLPVAAAPAEATPREAYKPIAEKNIFHPDRQEFPMTGSDQNKPSGRPQVALYGVVVARDYQSATIVSPGRPLAKGEREAKTVKLGDRLGDYKVAKIQEDRIVMESAGDSFEVLLHDPNAPKRRIEVRAPVPPVTVTSSTAAPAAPPGAAPVSPATSAAAVPSRAPSSAGVLATPPVAQPLPQGAAPKPAEAAGVAVQSETTPTPVTPGVGIWRGRRPFRPGDPATPSGN